MGPPLESPKELGAGVSNASIDDADDDSSIK